MENLDFFRKMAKSTAKLYLFYLLTKEKKHCHKIEDIKKITGISVVSVIKARKELEELGFISVEKKIIYGHKNNTSRIWVKLLHFPIIEKTNTLKHTALQGFRFYG